MSSKHTSRTTRRLLKLASLGLAGLLAGLLAGCSNSPKTVSTNSYNDTDAASQFDANALPPSLDAVSIPPLRHAPSARRLEEGSQHFSQPSTTTISLHGS